MKNIKVEETKSLETEFVKNVINQTYTALHRANDMKNDFTHHIFKMDYEKVEKMFKTSSFDWLPTLDFSSISKINSKHFGTFLPKLYTDLQVIAAGVDLVFTNEQYEQFRDTKYYLKLVLCEIFAILDEYQLTLPPDVTREIIPSDCALLVDQTAAKTRDWIIFREYVNMLEYILRIFRNHTPKHAMIIKNIN